MDPERTRQIAAAVLISAAVFAGLAALRSVGALQPLELLAYDLILALRSEPIDSTTAHVVLVPVREEDIASRGGWPMSDAALADLLHAIEGYGPRVIGLDIYRDLPVAPGTAALAETLASLPSVVAIYKFASPESPGVGAPPALADTERLGFSDVVLDPDGAVRRALAFLDDGERFGSSFALRLALEYLRPTGVGLRPDPKVPEWFQLGPTTVVPIEPNHGGYAGIDAGGYQFMIDFRDVEARFPRVALSDVVAGRLPTEALREKIVIVGVDAVSVKDAFATPGGQWRGSTDLGLPGVALHGVVVEQLIAAAQDAVAPLASWSEALEYAVLLAICLCAGLVGLQSRSARRLLAFGAAGVLLAWAAALGFFRAGVWIPVVPMAIGWVVALALVTGYLLQRERRDRALLHRMFAAQTSKEVAETLWARRQELLDEGGFRPQTLPATILFVDLGGFTGVSERLQPQELMRWVHRFMEVATRVVTAHGGMVDDYFGDGLKANFGAPFARERSTEIAADALAAVRCALALQAEVEALNATRGDAPVYHARVGVHSGTVVLGGVGNAERQKYTSIGDAVNVAARLESIGKELCGAEVGSVMVSAATARHLGDCFELYDHGEITLRGRAAPVRVYEVRGASAQQESGNVDAAHVH